MEDEIVRVLHETLHGLDAEILEYLSGVVTSSITEEPGPVNADSLLDTLNESVAPFLLSTGFVEQECDANATCRALATALFKCVSTVEGSSSFSSTRSSTATSSPSNNNCSVVRPLDRVHTVETHGDTTHTTHTTTSTTQALLGRMNGLHDLRKTTNVEIVPTTAESVLSARDKRKVMQQTKREAAHGHRKNAEAEADREWEDRRVLPEDNVSLSNGDRTSDKNILVPRLSIHFKGKTLLDDTALKLVAGRRYGLVGKNGCGKTTLLRFISRYEIDGFPRNVRIQLVAQESASKLSRETKSVLEVVLAADYERTLLLDEAKELLAAKSSSGEKRLTDVYDRLADIDADAAESRARTILHGLQFPPNVVDGPAKNLSGGWRMRAALAGALFMAPDLLLLDEPTNHLDLEAVMWLQQYLQTHSKTLIVVSHDRTFLNAVATDMVHFDTHTRKLAYYKGNYNAFETTQRQHLARQRSAYDAQQLQIKHMQEFIARCRANCKAALAQSRLKALHKIQRDELIEEPQDKRAFRMRFPSAELLSSPMLLIDSVSFQYSPKYPLLFQNVHMGIDMSSRIGIVGVNGSGKSTLVHILLGKLQATTGHVSRHAQLRISTFSQHHVDALDLNKSAVENMELLYAGQHAQTFRNHLGRFQLSGELATKPTRTLSGGQKSRVAFAIMTWRRPHLVVLDEPTNHLDMETVDALIGALREFKGGVVVVSHDQHFVSSVCDQLWVVGDGKVGRFQGSIDAYKKHVLRQ